MAVELFVDKHSPKHFCTMSATKHPILRSTIFWITHVILKLVCAYKTVKWRRDERLLGKDVSVLFPSHLQMQLGK